MKEKPVVVHVINSLARGGTETLLINLLPALNEKYQIILVTLEPENDFGEDKIICKQRYCLHYKGSKDLLSCAIRLRKIIRKHKPQLVRSQLYISSIVARLATPRNVPLVFSIHNPMSHDSYEKNRLALPLEKITYRRRHHLISVTGDALQDFDRHVGIKGPSHVLHNFINQKYLEKAAVKTNLNYQQIRLVAVGNLKEQKNYFYLIEAFKKLKNKNASLHIYGEGPLRQRLQTEIDKHNLSIVLKGRCKEVYNVLPDYDLYVMPSQYEGFANASIEAMAIGLPLLLSDLPGLREVTKGNALFFDPHNPDSLVALVTAVLNGEYELSGYSARGIEIVRQNYQQMHYLKKLDTIYRQAMADAVVHPNAENKQR